jgi:RNA polymerase sigma-70 factor (ECF subfamily)
MPELDDAVRRVRAGDLNAFREIVDSAGSAVRAVVAAMLPDPGAVDDAVQETFIIAFQRLHAYQPGTKFLAWIRTIARNCAQNERRRWYRQRGLRERYQSEIEAHVEEAIDAMAPGLPEDVFSALDGCMAGLKGKTQELVQGFYFQDRSTQALADSHEVSPGAVKTTLCRARQALANCLRRKGGGRDG